MEHTRLLTLAGQGGVGKTRLAIRLAAERARAFRDGVWLVELANLHQGELAAQLVADVLGLRHDSTTPLEQLCDYIRDRSLLLVVDNCEHLIEETSQLITTLLSVAPHLRVVATSRQFLGASGEQVLPVTPLSLPSADTNEPVRTADAVSLFTDRAQAADPEFRLTEANSDTIVGICNRLEGIPLALELAAVRLRAFTAEQILARLDDTLGLLNTGLRTSPVRQQTLANTVQWSYRLCTPAEQRLWRRLSVFSGGFTLTAAETVCASEAKEPVFESLYGLVEKSIVTRTDTDGTRYHLSEVLRQFGSGLLTDWGEAYEIELRHREHYHRLAERGDLDYCSPRDLEWFTEVRTEHPNLRTALAHALSTEDNQTALDMASALRRYWTHSGFTLEGFTWITTALDKVTDPSPVRNRGLTAATFLAIMLGEQRQANELYEQCLLAEQTDPSEQLHAENVFHSALITFACGDVPEACDLAQAAMKLCIATGDDALIGECVSGATILAFSAGEVRARSAAEDFLAMATERGSNLLRSIALWMVALNHWHDGDLEQCQGHIEEAIRTLIRFDNRVFLATCFEGLGWAESSRGNHSRAATLFGATDTIWDSTKFRLAQNIVNVVGEEVREQTHSAIGDATFSAALARGAAMTTGEAVEFAIGESSRLDSTRKDTTTRPTLTRREEEVANLVAAGLSNKEVATKLVISIRTAEAHVEHILSKLNFTSRSQIGAWLNNHVHSG